MKIANKITIYICTAIGFLTYFPDSSCAASLHEPFRIYKYTMDNGLRVWCQPRSDSKSVVVFLVVKVGSRYETVDNNGISHFVEHMVFTGTEKWNEVEIKSIINNLGGWRMGYTSREKTYYYTMTASGDLDIALEWMSQIVFHPTFPLEKVDKERHVIFQEKWGKYGWVTSLLERLGLLYDLTDKINESIFPDNSFTMKIIGEDESLDRIDRQALLDYYETFYIPNNIHLLVVGQIDPDEVYEKLQFYFGDAQSGQLSQKPETPDFPEDGPKRVVVRGPLVTDQRTLILGMRTVGMHEEDRWKLEVLAELLNQSLKEEIRYNRGLVYHLWVYNRFYEDVGRFCIHMRIEKENQEEAIGIIKNHIDKIKKGDIDSLSLAEAKTSLKGKWALSMESNYERAVWLEKWMNNLGDTEAVPDYNFLIDSVTEDDLVRVINAYTVPQLSYMALHIPILSVNRGAKIIVVLLICITGIIVFKKYAKTKGGKEYDI